jgi:hypothetical protein
MKDNDSVAYPVKQWRQLALPPIAWGVDITQLLHVCGQTLDLRAVTSEQGQQVLEVFCSTDAEHAQAEALLHQAAADGVLRRDINAQCSKEIGTLVDSVLKRATGG